MPYAHFILYVHDQQISTEFYTALLQSKPTLMVPGMTEFSFDGWTLGLMPEQGAKRLFGATLPDPSQAKGIPRAELYLLVDEPEIFYLRALAMGAKTLSPLHLRDWGHWVAYCLDPDSHVLAFAKSR